MSEVDSPSHRSHSLDSLPFATVGPDGRSSLVLRMQERLWPLAIKGYVSQRA